MSDDGLKKKSRSLRRNQTDAEKKLWRYLRSREFQGVKFRRQVALDPYVVDFCSFQEKLIIELDGGQHAVARDKDQERTMFLNHSGYRVIRFWNNDVLGNTEGVLETIRRHIKAPLTLPSPARGEGERNGNEGNA